MTAPAIRALVFDFDGLILETETPVLESWRMVYAEHGQELPMDTWLETIGTSDHDFDPRAHLEALVGETLDWEHWHPMRVSHRDAILHAQETLPGVREYIEDARRMGIKLAVASSSSRSWVEGHLQRLGIHEHWDAVRGKEDVARTKPDPELYLAAVEALGVAPREAVALEDSQNGIAAARDAGLWCVAIPGALTRGMDFSRADLVLGSLADVPLAELLSRLGTGPAENAGGPIGAPGQGVREDHSERTRST